MGLGCIFAWSFGDKWKAFAELGARRIEVSASINEVDDKEQTFSVHGEGG